MIKVKILLKDGTTKELYATDYVRYSDVGLILYWALEENGEENGRSRYFSINLDEVKSFEEED